VPTEFGRLTVNHCISCTWSVISSLYSDCGMWHLRLHNFRSQDSIWYSDSVGHKSGGGPNNTGNYIIFLIQCLLFTPISMELKHFPKCWLLMIYCIDCHCHCLSYSLVLQFSQSIAYTFPIKPAHNQPTQKCSRSDICVCHNVRWRVGWRHHCCGSQRVIKREFLCLKGP